MDRDHHGDTAALVLIAAASFGASACGLVPVDLTQVRSFVPDRGIGPWRVYGTQICVEDACGDEAPFGVSGVDVAWDGEAMIAVGTDADGALVRGELLRQPPEPGGDETFVLRFDAEPWMTPTAGWQASGCANPDLVLRDGEVLVIHGVRDGSAVGWARAEGDALAPDADPVLTAAGIGVASIGSPSVVDTGGELLVVFTASPAGTPNEIWATRGDDRAGVNGLEGEAEVILTSEDVDTSTSDAFRTWGPIEGVRHPDVGLTEDGAVSLFFEATGGVILDGDPDSAMESASIGYAGAAAPGERFTAFAGNPVHDRTYNYIFAADDRAPSWASDGLDAFLVYLESRTTSAAITVATHRLGR